MSSPDPANRSAFAKSARRPPFERVCIFGVGLLGGSLGRCIKSRNLAHSVVGVGRSEAALEEAVRLEAIDEGTTSLEEGATGADLIVLCTPVSHILDILPRTIAAARAGAIVTDVGSTKAAIVQVGEMAEQLRSGEVYFVGSHPMAGSEKSGVSHSRSTLFQDTTCFVTRTASTDHAAAGAVARFWRNVGCRVVVTRPSRHDRLVAMISHVPHLAAVALVAATAAAAEDRNLVKGILGNGFRDSTRIAAGSPDVWTDIFRDNEAEVAAGASVLQEALEQLRRALNHPDELHALLEHAAEYRAFLDPQ